MSKKSLCLPLLSAAAINSGCMLLPPLNENDQCGIPSHSSSEPFVVTDARELFLEFLELQGTVSPVDVTEAQYFIGQAKRKGCLDPNRQPRDPSCQSLVDSMSPSAMEMNLTVTWLKSYLPNFPPETRDCIRAEIKTWEDNSPRE